MEQASIEMVTRSLTNLPSRRDVLRGIAGTGLGLAALQRLGVAEAGKKNKRKNNKNKGKKKSKPLVVNQFGCVDAGQACRGDSNNCCSGICEGVAPRKGKPDTSRCVAHNAGVCTPETNTCDIGAEVPCGPNGERSVCLQTTGNAAFCGDVSAGVPSHCRACSKDIDCQGEFGAGAACVFLDGPCTPLCVATGRTACLPPGV